MTYLEDIVFLTNIPKIYYRHNNYINKCFEFGVLSDLPNKAKLFPKEMDVFIKLLESNAPNVIKLITNVIEFNYGNQLYLLSDFLMGIDRITKKFRRKLNVKSKTTKGTS